MTMRRVIMPIEVLRFEVIRLILSSGDNEVDGDETGAVAKMELVCTFVRVDNEDDDEDCYGSDEEYEA